MALQIWLPLTKDLRQQGLKNISVTNNGATYSSTGGKLGGCYSFDGVDDRIYANNVSINNSAMSACCWVKFNNLTSSDYPYIFALGSNTSGTGIQIGLAVWKSDSKIHLVGNGSEPSSGYTPPTNTWIHLCITINGATTKLYVNGILTNTQTNANSPKTQTCLCLGARPNSTSGAGTAFSYPINGYINDFRLYDHCLSPMEVKELAKGLVLYYPLNRQGWGQENILLNSVSEKTGASNSAQWFRWNTNTTLTANQTYTLSFDAKMTIATDVFYIGWANADSTQEVWNQRTQVTTEYKRYSFTGSTTKTNVNAILISNYKGYGRGNDNNTTGVLSVKNIKLEIGNKATPWCPNSSDTLATAMGLNSTIEYDCSGFCNNGTRIGTFTWTSNTAKYQVSQIFNGSDNAIQTPNLTTMVTDKNYTVACWTYKTVIGTKNYQTIYGGPSGFELEARSSSSTSPLYRIHNWGGGTTAYNFGEWTHFCFVHTDSDSKLYVNGELKITGTSANVPSGNYFVGAWSNSNSQNYEGNMSDFRIYATALSADDVLSLYQNNAYIDTSTNPVTIYGKIRD